MKALMMRLTCRLDRLEALLQCEYSKYQRQGAMVKIDGLVLNSRKDPINKAHQLLLLEELHVAADDAKHVRHCSDDTVFRR